MISVQRGRLLELSRQQRFSLRLARISGAKYFCHLVYPCSGAPKNSTIKQIWGNISNTALQMHLLSCSCHPIPISGVWTILSKLDSSLAGMAPFHAKSVGCPKLPTSGPARAWLPAPDINYHSTAIHKTIGTSRRVQVVSIKPPSFVYCLPRLYVRS